MRMAFIFGFSSSFFFSVLMAFDFVIHPKARSSSAACIDMIFDTV